VYYLKWIDIHHRDGKEDMMEADERHGVVVATVWSSWLKKFEENELVGNPRIGG
jgi:hypothetical protein